MASTNHKLGRLVFLVMLLLMAQYVSAVQYRTKMRVRMRRCSSLQLPGSGCPYLNVWVPYRGIIDAYCKKRGQYVGRDPWWIYAYYRGYTGWIPQYHVACPSNSCPLRGC